MTNLSLEYGFDSNTSDEVEPDDVESLQDQQQAVEQPPCLVRPDDLPALKQNAVNNPATFTHMQRGYWIIQTGESDAADHNNTHNKNG